MDVRNYCVECDVPRPCYCDDAKEILADMDKRKNCDHQWIIVAGGYAYECTVCGTMEAR